MSLTMEEWAMNNLYEELIKNPLWTLSAFGFLEEGQGIQSDDVRFKLITYLVTQHLNKCPAELTDEEYRSWKWKTSDYFPVVKQALKTCQKIGN